MEIFQACRFILHNGGSSFVHVFSCLFPPSKYLTLQHDACFSPWEALNILIYTIHVWRRGIKLTFSFSYYRMTKMLEILVTSGAERDKAHGCQSDLWKVKAEGVRYSKEILLVAENVLHGLRMLSYDNIFQTFHKMRSGNKHLMLPISKSFPEKCFFNWSQFSLSSEHVNKRMNTSKSFSLSVIV